MTVSDHLLPKDRLCSQHTLLFQLSSAHIRVATTEPDDDGDFWADHDENCHGIIDSKEMRDEFPDGFVWTCCERTGTDPGCLLGPHRSRFDPAVRMFD